MKKALYALRHFHRGESIKTLLIMKLTAILLLVACLQAGAAAYSQKVSISGRNIPLQRVFQEIRQQTGYTFFFDEAALKGARKLTLHLKEASLEQALDSCFREQSLSYTIVGRTIVVKSKDQVAGPDAQSITVLLLELKGVVTDEKGSPLAGVSITVKGTSRGTASNNDGSFSITIEPGQSLIFSMVGYKSYTLDPGREGKTTNLMISMTPEVSALSDMVVVGYGTQRAVDLTGAVSTTSGDVLKSRPIPNVGRGLQGILPGLNITSSDGQPGRGADFNIRGFTSINGGSPLILVDDVPTDINNINPDDVASVTVLKDAASAAVYGARAPFGVILITTRKGKKGSPKVSYSENYSLHKITHLPQPVIDPNTVVTYKNMSYAGYYGTNLYNSFYTDYARQRSLDPSKPAVILDPNNANNYLYVGATDWFHELYKPYNPGSNHNLSVSGGGDKITYYLSAGYNNQTGTYRYNPDIYNRYNIRAKLDFAATSWLTISSNSVYNRMTYNSPSLWTSDWTGGDLYHEIGRRNPLDVVKNPDGSWTSAGVAIGQLKDGGRSNTTTNEIQQTLGFTASFFNNSWRIRGDYTFKGTSDYNRSYQIALPYESGPNRQIYYAGHSDASAWSDNIAYRNITLYTEYEKKFGVDHYFKAMVGYNQELNTYDYFSASNNDLISSSTGYLNMTTGTPPTVKGYGNEWAIRGSFFRLNYAYLDRYLLEVNGRYDGSSRFPPNNHYAFFPSASAGWRIAEEPFFRGLKNTVNNLKVRASYGSLGNQNTIDPSTGNPAYYPYIPTLGIWTPGRIPSSPILGGSQPAAVYPPLLVSPNLTWERVYSRNLGIDLSVLHRLDASFDIFRRDTKDMLTKGPTLPVVLGAAQPLENAADLKTQGWELSLAYNDQFSLAGKPFRFTVKANIWRSNSYITRYNNPKKFWFATSNNFYYSGGSQQGDYYEGEKIGDIWGLTTAGIFQTDAEASKWADQSLVTGYYGQKAGEIKYADLNGDGKISYGDGTVSNPGDARVIGNTTPKYSFGLNGSFSWNNIDCSLFFQGVGKRDFWPGVTGYYWSQFYSPWDNVYKNIVGNTWTPQNPNAFYPSLKGWRSGDDGRWVDLAFPQTRYIFNAAYIRLKNITVGYTLPVHILRKLGVDQIRVYVSGEDLWESTKLPSAFDPEGLTGTWGPGKSYPFQRAYSAGINVRF